MADNQWMHDDKNNDKIVINCVHLPCSRTARNPYISYLLIV